MKETPLTIYLSQFQIVTLHSIAGVKLYRKFYTEEKEQAYGVLAIIVSKLALQPYIYLASLFSVGSLSIKTIATDMLAYWI